MRETTYFILVSLMAGPLHGYGIVKRAGELSDGRVKPTAGTLYGALDRLESEGHIVLDREETVKGRMRRYYRITTAGTAAAHAEVDRMNVAVKAISLSATLGPAVG